MTRRSYVYPLLGLAFAALTTSAATAQLAPRTPLPKSATITKPPYDSRLTLKFRDDLKVRTSGGNLTSEAGGDLSNVVSVQGQFALTFAPLIHLPQEALDTIETRAAQRSGVAQPDLAGMMAVYGPEQSMELAAQAFLALDEVEWVYFAALNQEDPTPCEIPSQGPYCSSELTECCDIFPNTHDYFAARFQCGDILDYHGPDDGGLDMTCAWLYGARGEGVTIADVETGYIQNHEDLCGIEDGSPPEDIPAEDHGTSVLGMLVAQDNGYGWTGLVPDATAWFYTKKIPGLEAPEGQATAIGAAILELGEEERPDGEILQLELQTVRPYSSAAFGAPAEVDLAVWLLTCTATQSDIIVVASAGNGNEDLGSVPYWTYRSRRCEYPAGVLNDSGAIIVGAGTADTTHDKMDFRAPNTQA